MAFELSRLFLLALLTSSISCQFPPGVRGFFNAPATRFNRGGRVNFAGLSLGQVCRQIMMRGGKEALSDGMGAAAQWFANQKIGGMEAGGTDPQMRCLYAQATGANTMIPGSVGNSDPSNIFGDYFDTVIEYPMIFDPCTAPQCNGNVNPSLLLLQKFARPMGGMGGMGGMRGMGGMGAMMGMGPKAMSNMAAMTGLGGATGMTAGNTNPLTRVFLPLASNQPNPFPVNSLKSSLPKPGAVPATNSVLSSPTLTSIQPVNSLAPSMNSVQPPQVANGLRPKSSAANLGSPLSMTNPMTSGFSPLTLLSQQFNPFTSLMNPLAAGFSAGQGMAGTNVRTPASATGSNFTPQLPPSNPLMSSMSGTNNMLAMLQNPKLMEMFNQFVMAQMGKTMQLPAQPQQATNPLTAGLRSFSPLHSLPSLPSMTSFPPMPSMNGLSLFGGTGTASAFPSMFLS